MQHRQAHRFFRVATDVARDRERTQLACASQRKILRRAHGLDARHRGDPIEQRLVVSANAFVTVPLVGNAKANCQHVVRPEARVDVEQSSEALCREASTDDKHDREDAPPVWIVNEAFAKRYFPNESPVGKVVRMGPVAIQIIGVVGDFRQKSLTEPAEPYAYIHYPQNMRVGMSIAVRTAGDPLRYANAVREAIWSVDRDQTITNVETLSAIVGDNVARPRLLATLLVLFGVMGLTLGVLGIYGVLAYAVSQRRQEIGVRVALGATPRAVLGLVVGQGMLLAGIGVAAGIAGALVLTRVMATVLYEVRTTDPATFAAVVAVLLGAALVASWLPARRALRIDPVQALRYD